MKINIINISDFPAKIYLEEIEKAEYFFKENNIITEKYNFINKKVNLKKLKSVLESSGNEVILFSSWWIDAINNMKSIWNNIWTWIKVLLWFSDTLHIQGIFHNYKNIFNIYWVTFRNIFELSKTEKTMLFDFIEHQKYSTKLKIHSLKNDNIAGKIYGWDIIIFINLLSLITEINLKGSILFLEFHSVEESCIYYYLDFLKVKWIFSIISWIILDKDNPKIISYLQKNDIENIYSLSNISFIPLYKKVEIKKWILSIG